MNEKLKDSSIPHAGDWALTRLASTRVKKVELVSFIVGDIAWRQHHERILVVEHEVEVFECFGHEVAVLTAVWTCTWFYATLSVWHS